MKSGDTFLIKYPRDTFHLFVVVSAPESLPDVIFPDRVFLVMITTREAWKDNSCILRRNEHPFLKHDSVAAFDSPPSLWTTLEHLQDLKKQKRLIEKEPVTESVLQRLRNCYADSDYQKDTIFQFLFRQGVVK